MDNCQLLCRCATIFKIVLIGLTQQTDKLEFAEERTAPEQRVIKEPVLLTGVGISLVIVTACFY